MGDTFIPSPKLTSVDILNYTLTKNNNFEADIRLSSYPGFIQVKTLVILLNTYCTCFHVMQIEAELYQITENISLDNISCILLDVNQDSSRIVDYVV